MNQAELQAKMELRQLVDEYAFAVDGRDPKRFSDLFTQTATLEIYERDSATPAIVYSGASELETVVELVADYVATFHVMANHGSGITGEQHAAGWTYCLAHHLTEHEESELEDTVMLIRYEDEYIQQAGCWRFARRKVMRQWNNTLPADSAPMDVLVHVGPR